MKQLNIFTVLFITVITTLALLIFAICIPKEAKYGLHVDYIEYNSVDDLIKSSDLIITGIPLSSNSTIQYPNIDTTVGNEFTNPQWGLAISEADMKEMGIPATISSVRVTKVLKGNISPNSTINIVQLGGTINGINIRDDTSVLLDEIHSTEDQLLLLLSATGNKQYSIISPNAGILSVNSGGYISPFKTLDKTLYKSSLNSYYDLIDRNTHDQKKQ